MYNFSEELKNQKKPKKSKYVKFVMAIVITHIPVVYVYGLVKLFGLT